jgi:nitronate monooxygenase
MSGFHDTEVPIIAAPMAGGPSTPALVNAVADAGGFGFLAAGYKTPEALEAEIKAVRGTEAFGVNLFVPQRDDSGALRSVDRDAFAAYADALREEAAALGLSLAAEPTTDDDAWHDKLDVLTADPVPVVSLTFGLPSPSEITTLQRDGTRVFASITTPGEAREAAAAGVDGLVVQGPRAGGHSATFDPTRQIGSEPTVDVLQAVRAVTGLPLIATGGVDGPRMVAELVRAGAEGVAVGTLLLAADEAGTSPVHRAALADARFTETVVTTAFTGRPARALRNDFIDRYAPIAPPGYPAIHHLTRQLRQLAAQNGNPHLVHLWAGTGHANVAPGPVATIIDSLSEHL